MPTISSLDDDNFYFDYIAYLDNEDYADWVDLEIVDRDHKQNGVSNCIRVI